MITDPRTLRIPYPRVSEPDEPLLNTKMLIAPPPADEAAKVELVRGENIVPLPELGPLPDSLEVAVLLKMRDNISTDEILPAGARVLPYRSNVPALAEFAFDMIDQTYPKRAREAPTKDGHAVVGGRNYGQGSSREHAALAPRFLGLRLVIAKSFARIHWQNLINFGVLPLTLAEEADYDRIESGDVLRIANLHEQVRRDAGVALENVSRRETIQTRHNLSARQIDVLLCGGLINWVKRRRA